MKFQFLIISLLLPTIAVADEALDLLEKAFVPKTQVIQSEVEDKSRSCLRTRVLLSTPDPLDLTQTREIEYVEYRPRKAEIIQNMIMMPPTGGVTFVDKQIAKRLCKKGALVLLHYHFTGDMESSLDPSIHEKAFVRAITAIRHMALQFEGDFGIIGTSLGSLYSSQALIAEPRITKALFVVGGAPVTEILSLSEQDGLVDLREARMNNLGLRGTKEYSEYLQENFRMDLLSRFKPKQNPKVWIIRSLKDDTVPTSSQNQLVKLLNPKKVTDSKAGHRRTIFNLVFKKSKITDFFLE